MNLAHVASDHRPPGRLARDPPERLPPPQGRNARPASRCHHRLQPVHRARQNARPAPGLRLVREPAEELAPPDGRHRRLQRQARPQRGLPATRARCPALPGGVDDTDVALEFFMDDVFTNALADYSGELRASVPLRITDKDNTPNPGGPGAATTHRDPARHGRRPARRSPTPTRARLAPPPRASTRSFPAPRPRASARSGRWAASRSTTAAPTATRTPRRRHAVRHAGDIHSVRRAACSASRLLVLSLSLGSPRAAAQASFPGANGKILLERAVRSRTNSRPLDHEPGRHRR